MKNIIITSLLLSTAFLISCDDYKKQIKNVLKIEHVYNRPNNKYGPPIIIRYTKKSNYTEVCSPHQVLGINENTYKKNIISGKLADIGKVDYGQIETNVNIKLEDFKNIKNVNAELIAKYSRIKKIKLNLTSGKLWKSKSNNISDFINNITKNKCINNIKTAEMLEPNSDFYIACEVYAFDIASEVLIDNKWESTVNIPKEILEVISAKLSTSGTTSIESKISGKNLYVGFNGYNLKNFLKQYYKENKDKINKSKELLELMNMLQIKE